MRTARRAVFWAMGLSLLAVLIYEVGIIAAWEDVRQMGWGYVPVLLIALSWHASNAWAWAMCFDGERPGFWVLLRTKISGEAVGNVTPASHVGGEVAKAYMLRGQVAVTRGVPSLVVNKTVELVSGLGFALVGAGVAVYMFPLPVEVQIGLGAALVLGTAGIVAAYVSQRQQASVWMLNVLKKLRLSFLESKREKFEEVDRTIAAFYRQNRMGFWLCMALHGLSWILGTFEIYAILHLLGESQCFLTAFLLMSLSLVINTAFFFIPSGVGVFESGHVFLFQLLGLTPELGLGVALIRRIRRIFWVIVGFVLMAVRTFPSQQPISK